MDESLSWLDGVRGAVAECATVEGLGIAPAEGRATAPALASRGFPGLVPLWTGARSTIALLPLPTTELRSWPAVIEKDGESLILATNCASALPRFWMLRLLAYSETAGSRLAQAIELGHEKAAALHHALGGTAETLATMQAAIADAPVRAALVRQPGGEPDLTYGALARRIDPGPQFASYADWFDAVAAGGKPDLPDSSRLGIWNRQAAYWAARVGPPDPPMAVAQRFEALEAFAGIGSGVPSTPIWSAQPGSASGRVAHYDLAARIDPDAAEDEVHRGILTALHSEGIDYDGLAHAEAVVALDEGGKPERAWGALHSAAWWGSRAVGEAPAAILDGARLLASRHGWDEIAWAVRCAEGGT
jgi:hypothetical protein